MRRPWAVTALVAAVLVAVPPLGNRPAAAIGKVNVLSCNGCWPTAFDFSPNGRYLYYAERFSGEIRKHNLRTGNDSRWGRIPGVADEGEQGLLGLALDPDWQKGRRQQWIYYYYTDEGSPDRNRIARARKKRGGGLRRRRLASIAAETFHNGGVIHFGPDDKLYAVTGDAGDPSRSQAKKNLSGKVLRIEQNGDRPPGNPIPGSKAFSYGHRNSFGFAFDPETGDIFQSENGPECDDEVNLVKPGKNYGWGGASDCPNTSESGPNPVQPLVKYNPVIAPTGAAFCDGCGLGAASEGDLFMGDYNQGRIHRLDLNAARDDISGQTVVLDNPRGILAVEDAPNGRIFFSDQNGIYRLRR